MFCNQCGASLPDGSKFCSICGADLTPAAAQTSPKQQPAAPSPQPARKPNTGSVSKPAKKKTPIWLTLVIVLAAFLLGKFVIAPAMLSEPSSTGGNSEIPQTTSGNVSTAPNPAYDAVLQDHYIVHFQMFFNMDTASFVKELEDGTVCCSDYGYKDDMVIEYVETMYIPISEYTDTQKTDLETTMKSQFAAVDALNCCAVTYKASANYLTITCTYSNVDKAENYAELYHAQILQANTFISMSATETGLLGQGFIKK